ncbi:carnitinyl-CoA dehydratase [Hypericibacter adhaerens]|jgi:crotonobetainyl-CoA hydratase|uniref:Carnitinyl-CoA dehydratase n=1 Tax=Hypericibacter adhaerens TaxID=2602016 RepID=A0A5J6N1G4_9PROT|nr:enoyl-CoA hydratase-related protein [Hypericibacter adhaerens]QEX22795.1 carnitinyl-CoA dehydratase [Hypericibacter adhaerens]
MSVTNYAEGVRTERRGQVIEITLDRPKANAIDPGISQRLGEIFSEYRDDPSLRVAIVTAAGRFFSGGWDLKSAAPDQDFGRGGFAGLTEMFNLRKPVIAAVNGIAAGGGFELALACDLIVAAESAEFMLPEVKIGLIPDGGGVLRLPKRLPRAIATELLMTGRRMGAPEADRHGLLNRCVPLADLMPAARALADDLVASAPLAVMAVKAVLQATEALTVEDGYKLLTSGALPDYQRMRDSEDYWEGPKAFQERRPPVWKGR